jgi:diaminohydroxyphosphoribosylaminopyrimidine deaminase/5-amino-6-(5-phosphoribosylamino)uracil reductase
VIVHGESIGSDRTKPFQAKNGVTTLPCAEKEGRIDLDALLSALGSLSISSLLVEGGARLMGSLIRENLIDKYFVFFAPKILGGGDGVPLAQGEGPKKIEDCLGLKEVRVRRFGNDVLVQGYPREKRKATESDSVIERPASGSAASRNERS